MADQLQLRGGTTAEHASFVGAPKEITVDTTKRTLVVHDGATAGGVPLARAKSETYVDPTLQGTVGLPTGGISAAGHFALGGAPGTSRFEISHAGTNLAQFRNVGSQVAYMYLGTSDNPVIADVTWGSSDANNGYWAVRTRSGGIQAERIRVEGTVFRPGVDNGHQLGASSHRWAQLHAATSTIATSDARAKQWRGGPSPAELRVAARLGQMLGLYKFLDAIAAKGDQARIHCGIRAQDVETAFAAEGLDARDYGLLCFDEWEAEYDAEGALVRPAGDRFGIRYEELFAFLAMGWEARLAALEAATAP